MSEQNALYMETIHTFLTLYRHLRQHSRQMQDEGLSGRKIATLRHLHNAGPQTVGQLADYLYISNSSTSELIDHLETLGYVTRARSPKDNRVVIVTLTEAGAVLAQTPPTGGVPLLRERLKTLPAEQLASINQAIAQLATLLEIADDC
ncbi:MAG: MarR family transcriptional regulator [Anaerolineae bacterium]|nr:MarR family transcriptional regulator [Anaerolineae bacterium]